MFFLFFLAEVHITNEPQPGHSPKHKIRFTASGQYMAINTTNWTVKALVSSKLIVCGMWTVLLNSELR